MLEFSNSSIVICFQTAPSLSSFLSDESAVATSLVADKLAAEKLSFLLDFDAE